MRDTFLIPFTEPVNHTRVYVAAHQIVSIKAATGGGVEIETVNNPEPFKFYEKLQDVFQMLKQYGVLNVIGGDHG